MRRAVLRRVARSDLLACAAQRARRQSIGNTETRYGDQCAFLRGKVVLFMPVKVGGSEEMRDAQTAPPWTWGMS